MAEERETAEAHHQPGASSDMASRRRFGRGRWKLLAVVAATLAILVALGAAGVSYATYDYARQYRGRLLPGTEIVGVDVSGMTHAQAVRAVRGRIRPQLNRKITVAYHDRKWVVTPARLGARSNVRAVVHHAFAASAGTSFFDKMRMKMLGDKLNFQHSVAISFPRAGVRGFVEGVASSLSLPPRDASIDFSTGWVRFSPAREGRAVEVRRARAAVMRALKRGSGRVALPVRALHPEVTSAHFAKVLLVRIGENRLYLYENGKITHSWVVATGQPQYPTPEGLYEVTAKRYMPTWINPQPDTWGASLPAEIPPGPDNPLGFRALNWSAPGILFHGTTATYSLGYNASHGCVRLSNPDVIQLYGMIDVGTPIASVVAAPLKPLYTTSVSTDPTPVAPGGSGHGGGKK